MEEDELFAEAARNLSYTVDIFSPDYTDVLLFDTVTTGAEEEREAIGSIYRIFYSRLLEYRMHRTVALTGSVFRAWKVLCGNAQAKEWRSMLSAER